MSNPSSTPLRFPLLTGFAGIAGTAAVVLSVLMVAASTPALAQSLEEDLAEHFQALQLRDGLVLRPVDSELGIGAIEISGTGIAVDGVAISLDELEARIGAAADPVARLLALNDEDRLALLSADAPVAAESSADASVSADDEETADAESDEDDEDRARRPRNRRHRRADTQVVVANSLTVDEDDVSRDVVVLGGSLTVRGRVMGDAAAIGGSARVSGEVDGDLVAVGGSVKLEDGARIRGDVTSVGGEVTEEGDVEVDGQVIEIPFGPAIRFGELDWDWDFSGRPWKFHRYGNWFGGFRPFGYMFGIGWEIFCLGVMALLACLVLLLAPRPVEQVGRKVAAEPWKSGLAGLLAQVLFVPILAIVCIILAISIIGIPLLILVPFAMFGLVLVAFLGYTAVAQRVGKLIENRFGWKIESPYLVLLLGFAAIQVWSFIGSLLDVGWGPLWFFGMMFALVGCLVGYVVWTVGFGAALLTRFGTSSGWGDDAEQALPPAPPSYADTSGYTAPKESTEVIDWDTDMEAAEAVVEEAGEEVERAGEASEASSEASDPADDKESE